MSNEKHFDYHDLVKFMKELRAYFKNGHEPEFTLGKINQSSKDYTYFSVTPEWLKNIKLKFVIIFDHVLNCFTICLSGQNKSIRQKYWQQFKESDWGKYHLAESIDNSLMIIDKTVITKADFSKTENLTQQIEKEALIFINEIKDYFEKRRSG